MIEEDGAKLVWDARRAADRIARFSAGRTLADYFADDLLRSGIERQFEIIGEALRNLRRVAPSIAAAIPDCARIIAFRNILVHAYDTIDNDLVWSVVETELDGLRSILSQLLDGA